MHDKLRRITNRLSGAEEEGPAVPRLKTLRAAAAELLVATAVDAAFRQLQRGRTSTSTSDGAAPRGLTLAPLLIAPLAALAHLEHARRPTDRTATALRLLNTATLAAGGALLLFELLEGDQPQRKLAPLGLASAGLLGFALDADEVRVARTEEELKQRARVVERLVPRRKARLDRVVVHV